MWKTHTYPVPPGQHTLTITLSSGNAAAGEVDNITLLGATVPVQRLTWEGIKAHYR